jgi:hypothetical protein
MIFRQLLQHWSQKNEGWATSNGEQSGRRMRITGMAAGFDTRARFQIAYRHCNSIRWNCRWKYIDEVLEPRAYKTWTFNSHGRRFARIDSIEGESRVHIATTFDN